MKNINTAEHWDYKWSPLDKQIKYAYWTMERIMRMIPEGSKVLDIGCGTARFIYRLKKELNCDVYGIDISPRAVERAKNEFGVECGVYNAENLDNFEGEYDVVVCTHVLEHITNDKGLVKNIARLTKSLAFIAVPNNCAPPEETKEHVRAYTAESMIKLLKPYFSEITDHTLKNHLILKCRR